MVCYNCGANLTHNNFCTNCGADVAKYKKIVSLSNLLYNEGLERASIRDLSGAISVLKQSLKLDKNHVEARNLLGLIYYEMGEYVDALSQWVISKNLRPEKNIADDYIGMIQSNLNSLDAISLTIKKYNQALTYCYQGSLDLATIQLKNVLSSRPNYVQARQLMALINIQEGHYSQAKKELLKCKEIDVNNTTTLRYLHEVDAVLDMDEGILDFKGKKNKSDVIQYQVDNQTIIQPRVSSLSKTASTVINIFIGIAIGAAIVALLVMPARVTNSRETINEELKVANEQLDAKNAEIAGLKQDIKALDSTNARLNSQLEMYVGEEGVMSAADNLLTAVSTYINNPTDVASIAEYLDNIDETMLESASETFIMVYDMLLDRVGNEVSIAYYDIGIRAYQNENYEEAVYNLSKAYNYDNNNQDALFSLGNAYRKMGDNINAIDAYNKVVELFPGTDRASRAKQYVNELSMD